MVKAVAVARARSTSANRCAAPCARDEITVAATSSGRTASMSCSDAWAACSGAVTSVATIFRIFPPAILGVILFFTGLELASISRDIGNQRSDVYIMLVTAGLAMWNMGVAYLAGLLLYYGAKKQILKF